MPFLELTHSERRVLEAWAVWTDWHGVAPRLGEVGALLGLSKTRIYELAVSLKDAGLLTAPVKHSLYFLTPAGRAFLDLGLVEVPLYGDVR